MNNSKFEFIISGVIPRLKSLASDTPGNWGKMNAQQMVEHLADFFKISTGKLIYELVTPEDLLPKFKAFLMSEKEFRENTKAPVLPDEPFPLRNKSMDEAIEKLEGEIKDFVEYFKDDVEKKTVHPAFGPLNYAEWIQLHHKHVMHHLKQFGCF